jgi:hypothetical protein
MPRQPKPWTQEMVNNAKPGNLSIGDHLMLRVGPTGSRSYSAQVTYPGGKRRRLGVGSASKLTLEEAKRAARHMVAMAAAGEDVKVLRREARALAHYETADSPSVCSACAAVARTVMAGRSQICRTCSDEAAAGWARFSDDQVPF